MAIISCPCCGQSISDKADKCVHCNAEFKHCKNCGKQFAGENELYEQCDQQKAQQSNDTQSADNSIAEDNDVEKVDYLQTFYNDCPRLKKFIDKTDRINKYVKILRYFIYAFDLILLVLWCVTNGDIDTKLTFKLPIIALYFATISFSAIVGFGYFYNHAVSYKISIQSYKWNVDKKFAHPKFLVYAYSTYTTQDNKVEYNRLLDFDGGYTYYRYPKELFIAKIQFWIRAIIEFLLLSYLAFIFPSLFSKAVITNDGTLALNMSLPLLIFYAVNCILFWVFCLANSIRTKNYFKEDDI
ncbi:hypothetical protein [Anaerocaecibacter muris]|uniref:hypothetical protein n=1 Tax=Anaerocaecibacter muris TaxID=2941513 RepID=UPI00203FA2DE|nr:hypothetical protein [Anaerocaecibacter muris]